MAQLALLGGPKAVTKSVVGENGIASFVPKINEKARTKINELLDKGEISESPVVTDFETRFRNYIGTQYALCQCSGTMSIQAGLFGLGVGRGDEVIVPSFTFFASATPILPLGATPVFADVDPDSHCVDPADIEKRITPKTKAIVVVHVWGNPCDMDAIMAIAKKHNIKVLEDCSHAHGAEYKGKKVGSFGDVGCFSLQGSKLMYGGEAGILVTNDENVYFRAASLGAYERLYGYGFYADLENTQMDNIYKQYKNTALGMKLRVHPLAIAIADSELDQLDARNVIRNTNAEYFNTLISDIDCIHNVKVYEGASRVYGYHYMRYDHELNHEIRRETILKALVAEGVTVGACGYGHLHHDPVFSQLDGNWPNCYPNNPMKETGTLPVTEYLHDTVFMAAPRFEDPNGKEAIEQYAEAYHKVIAATDDLKKYEAEHTEELAAMKPKSGRSINIVK